MQKIYLFIFLILIGHVSVSQSILFDYDDAGNRILRKVSGALPVTLISFVAEKSEETSALLTWQTASETNSDRFDIERSRDGKKWTNIGNVTASGDKKSSSSYSFTDKSPLDGENLYRLKMIDKDGTFSFSRIQSLNFDSQISFYPNPVKDLLIVKGIDDGEVRLINNVGKVVREMSKMSGGRIDMNGLPTGIYIIRIIQPGGNVSVRKVAKE